jgi:SRSO17 transposase
MIDETGFLKQGRASCGVARQYTGSAGKITKCQIGVFAAYVSRHGHAFIDRALYLPKSWTSDSTRMKAAHVSTDMGFATKPQLAVGMIERALAARVPFAWVAGDRSRACPIRRRTSSSRSKVRTSIAASTSGGAGRRPSTPR